MALPSLLYLDNRYFYSVSELKSYVSSNLNDKQKEELIAAFRDNVLSEWLLEGDEESQRLGEHLKHFDETRHGNIEILDELEKNLISSQKKRATYRFSEHAEFVGCRHMQTDEDFSEEQTVSVNGLINVKNTVNLKLIFRFKLLKPVYDFLTLSYLLKKDNGGHIFVGNNTLWLDGVKNNIKEIELNIETENVIDEDCELQINYGSEYIGGIYLHKMVVVNMDTPEDNESLDSTPHHFIKEKLVARVAVPERKKNNMDNSDNSVLYGFYNAEGMLKLKHFFRLLKNEMYPDTEEFEFGFYWCRMPDTTKRLFYIDTEGYYDFGTFCNAIPLNEELIAVNWDESNSCYGIIDKRGKTLLEDSKYRRICGISQNGYLVCEILPDEYDLLTIEGNKFCSQKFVRYFVNPHSDFIYAIADSNQSQLYRSRFNSNNPQNNSFERFSHSSNDKWIDIKVYKESVIAKNNWNYFKFDGNTYPQEFNNIESWKWNYIFVNSNDSQQGTLKLGGFVVNGYPIIASDKWSIAKYGDNYTLFTKPGESLGRLNDCMSIYNSSDDNLLVVYQINGSIFFAEFKDIEKNIRDVKDLALSNCQLHFIVSYDNYICIHYYRNGDKSKHYTLIVSKEGNTIKEDKWGDFQFLCGPFNQQYYYLKEGELYCKNDKDKRGTQKTSNLQAKALFPLIKTKTFLIENNCGFQIVDINGNKLGEAFTVFNTSPLDSTLFHIWDYILHLEYFPISNKEGKYGVINGKGKLIAPCEYIDAQTVKTLFKEKGIMIY